MLLSFDETSKIISSGKLLHIAGTESLLKKLPQGNWIGGSTEYFMDKRGGIITNEQLFVNEFSFSDFKISIYDADSISNVTVEAYDNGFSIVIIPLDSDVYKVYAAKASEFEGMFIKNIVGWISGFNLNASGQTAITVNGLTGDVYTNEAVVVHIGVPDDKLVSVGIINIFDQDETSPEIEFLEEGSCIKTCLINGKETVFADYITQNKIDTKLPLVGDYSGNGINSSFQSVENGIVNIYAPVFPGIKYRCAKPIASYVEEFNSKLKSLSHLQPIFSLNCVSNFLYGELEGKKIDAFFGPNTFGEIAYQLLNQTLVYVIIS